MLLIDISLYRLPGPFDLFVDCACGVNDPACTTRFAYDFHFPKMFKNFIVHAVPMTPHVFKKIRNSSRIRIYIRKGFSPLMKGPRTEVLMKTEGRKSRDIVPLNERTNKVFGCRRSEPHTTGCSAH
jgi:hypothetical protein